MMAVRLYNTERWTEEDDRLLRIMSETGKSLTLMTARLKRPMTAIKAMAEDLGISILELISESGNGASYLSLHAS
jgi:hypothetical protein